MKKVFASLLVLLLGTTVYAQQNMLIQTLGVEQGILSPSNWRSDTALCCPNLGWQQDFGLTAAKVTSSNSFNNYNLFPSVDPIGGNHSVRLGDWNYTSPMIRLMDTVQVDSFNYYFRFSLAALRKTWNGMPALQGLPYFRFWDVNGNALAVTNQVYYNSLNAYNWQKAAFDTTWQFLSWKDQFVNLFGYAGQKVIITYEMSNAPLSNLSGAGSLAYFDLRSVGTLLPKENYCGGSNLELVAPQGIYDSVVWKNNAGITLGHGAKLLLSNLSATNIGDSIEMNLFPSLGQGANFSYWHTLKMAPTIFKFADFVSVENCVNNQTQFNRIGDTSIHMSAYAWSFGDLGAGAQNYATNASPIHNYATAGTYAVKLVLTTTTGCVDSITKSISIGTSPIVNAGGDFSLCPLQTINLNGSLSNASATMLLQWQYQNATTQISAITSLNPAIAITANEIFVLTVIDTFHQCNFSDTVLASIQTVCVNHVPIANADSFYVEANRTIAQNLDVLKNDIDHDGPVSPQGNLSMATMMTLQNPLHGAVAYSVWDRRFYYLPNAAFFGVDSFTYILADNGIPNLSDTATVILNVVPALQSNTSSINATVCAGSSIQLNPPLITGGSGNYNYNWQSGGASLSCTQCTSPFVQLNANSTVLLTVSDNLLDSQNLQVFYYLQYDSIITSLVDVTLGYGDSLALGLTDFSGASSIVNVIWTPNLNCGTCSSGFFTPLSTTALHFQVLDANGCSLNDSIIIEACSSDCVWPGDCNHDGIVDNFDVLNIGLGYGWTGTARNNATGQFQGMPSNNWNQFTAPTIDAKHADADGDGLIDATDTSYINYYYGFTHPKQSSTNGVPLYVEFSTATAVNGDHVYADIHLGSATIPADSIYGLAFTFSFDSNVVVPNSAYIHRVNSNWLASPGFDGLDMSFNQFSLAGDLHYALVRTDHTVKSGYGPVARADMDIQTGNIAGKGNQLKHYNFIATLKHVRIVDLQGNERNYTLGADTIDISYFTGISAMSMNQVFSVAPNPTSDYVHVQSLFPLHDARVQMFDMKGMQIKAPTTLPSQGMNITTSELKNGVYLLQINAAEGVWKETIIVQH